MKREQISLRLEFLSLENIAKLAVALDTDAADLVKGLQKLKGRD